MRSTDRAVTQGLTHDVNGFLTSLVVVTRKCNGAVGHLEIQGSPHYYFNLSRHRTGHLHVGLLFTPLACRRVRSAVKDISPSITRSNRPGPLEARCRREADRPASRKPAKDTPSPRSTLIVDGLDQRLVVRHGLTDEDLAAEFHEVLPEDPGDVVVVALAFDERSELLNGVREWWEIGGHDSDRQILTHISFSWGTVGTRFSRPPPP